jgi:sulfide dehydrogenase [flavocytochrome c] flavoprotein subunit
MKRRELLKAAGLGVGASVLGFPHLLLGAASARVLVVGGGTGGATVAKYLKRADASIEVTLIEPDPVYHTCYMSNEVIGGRRAIEDIRVDLSGLAALGVQVVQDSVSAIDPVGRTATTASGVEHPYDRCVVSPGIDFKWETVSGYDAAVAERIPHAWKAGGQTSTLRGQLEAMADGGVVIVAPPENPYRCPPAPYERVSQIAMYLKASKPASKILVLDAKGAFAKQAAFELAWERLYGYRTADSMIEWLPGDGVVALDEANSRVTTSQGFSYRGDVINLIPAQKANAVAVSADLADGDWCPVERRTFESSRYADIHVIGDACTATELPKSGFAANAEGKACAAAIAAMLRGDPVPNPAYTNTCYSIVGADYGISTVSMYRLADDGSAIIPIPGAGGVTPPDASDEDLRREAEYARSWYRNFVKDVFR